MKPYFQEDGITIYHGNCLDLLPSIDNVDLIVTDPPYGETSLSWDLWNSEWLSLRHAGSMWCFGTLRMFMEHAGDFAGAGWKLSQDIIWEKHNGSGLRADCFRRVHEQAAHFYYGRWEDVYRDPVFTLDATARTVRKKGKPAHWHGATGDAAYESIDGGPRLMRSVMYCRSEHGRAEHPTQKPLAIMQALVSYACPKGGVVLDPFAGAGSTLIAAKETGRSAIGIEIDERYCEATAKRLAQKALALV